MAELADAPDLGSGAAGVWVRPPLNALDKMCMRSYLYNVGSGGEMVDTKDLKSFSTRSAGSSPARSMYALITQLVE